MTGKPFGRPPNYPAGHVIYLMADAAGVRYGPHNNPKHLRSKSHEKFELYRHGMTVADFIALAGQDWRWMLNEDAARGLIDIQAP